VALGNSKIDRETRWIKYTYRPLYQNCQISLFYFAPSCFNSYQPLPGSHFDERLIYTGHRWNIFYWQQEGF